MEQGTKNILIIAGALAVVGLGYYLLKPKKKDEEVLRDVYDNLQFEVGKDVILASSYPSLNALSDVLMKRPEWRLTITGHTDNTGTEKFNQQLSLKRAQAVQKYLALRGVNTSRIVTAGKGSKEPIADNKTEIGKKMNRRVEFFIDKGVE